MKIAKPLVASIAAVLLAACASSGNSYATRTAPSTSRIALDVDKVAAVENVASRRNLEVVWFNPPTVRNDVEHH